jgi:thymidylate kinase
MIEVFLKYLTNNSIEYVITNGYEELLQTASSENDVDILFKKKDFLQIEEKLKIFCDSERFKIVQIYHQEVYAKNIFLYNPLNQEILNLDIYGLLHKNHTIYFSEEEIFKNRTSFNDIKILATHQEFFNYFLKKLSKGDLEEKVFKYIKNLFDKAPVNCTKAIEDNLIKTGELVLNSFKNNDFSILQKERKNILLDIKISKPSSLYWVKDKVRFLKRLIKPTGISVAFLGPDGSGKTTIINGLLETSLPFRETNYFHLKPIYSSSITNEVTSNPHEFEPYGKVKSYVKLLYFLYQYNFGWLKNIISLKIKSSFIIFDRYFDDLIVDNRRYRYGGGNFIAKVFRIFIKKPALYFILVTDAEIIYKRKQEVAFSELENQITKYRSLSDNKRYFEIDVKESPNVIVKKVQGILMTKMNERY